MIIAGVSVGAMALPETPERILQRSIGVAWGGSVKIKKFRDADLEFTINLVSKSTALISSLYTALAAAQATTLVITPDSHVDLGNAVGASVNAYWISNSWTPRKNQHDAWDLQMRFRYSS